MANRAADPAEKLLPQNVDAEGAVLGSIEIDPDALARVRALGLRPEDFYREAHRTIYQAMVDWAETTGAAPDFITLCDELARRGKLDEVGGTAFVGSLANRVPSSLNAEHYARIVLRTAILRRLIHAAGTIAGVAYNEPDADVAMEQAFRVLHDVDAAAGAGLRHRARRAEGYLLDDVFDEVEEEFTRQLDGQPAGLMTGFGALDRHTAGLLGGELVYLGARPGAGKTSLVAALALALATAGHKVEWFTMEMRRKQQVRRLIAMQSGLDTRTLRAGFRINGEIDDAAYHAALLAVEDLRPRVGKRIRLHDTRISVEQLRERLEWSVAEWGTEVAMVDYFGLLTRDEARGRGASRVERMTEISAELKQIALSLDIPLIVLAQLNREVTHRADPRPELSDIRETGGTEQDADWVWGLHRPAYYDQQRAQGDPRLGLLPDTRFAEFAELHILKARDGSSGVVVPLRFDGPTTRFSEWPAKWGWPHDPTRGGAPKALRTHDQQDQTA